MKKITTILLMSFILICGSIQVNASQKDAVSSKQAPRDALPSERPTESPIDAPSGISTSETPEDDLSEQRKRYNAIDFANIKKGYQDEAGVYHAPIVYGEIINGTFARCFSEEQATIPFTSEITPEIRLEELNKLADARRIPKEAFTKEMELDGYKWRSEDAVMELEIERLGDAPEDNSFIGREDLDSDVTYNDNGDAVVPVGKGYVTFSTTVHPDIHEVCNIQVTSSNSFKTYRFEIFEFNDYTTSVQLPAGNYYVSGGGIANDYTSAYPISNTKFEVKEGAAVIVPITIGNFDKEALKNGNVIKLSEDKEEETTTASIDEKPTNNKNKHEMTFMIIRIVLLLMIVAVGIVFYIKKYGIKGR